METLETGNKNALTTATEKIPDKLLTPVEPTLVANMERVIELAVELNLSDTIYSVARPYLGFIADRMSLTEKQALLLSLFLEKSSIEDIEITDLAELVNCRTIRIITLLSEVDTLAERGFIRCYKQRRSTSYCMPIEVSEALKNNIVYVPEPTKGLSLEKFFDKLNEIFDNYQSSDKILKQVDVLIEDNINLEFCRAIKSVVYYGVDRLLLYILCNRFINEGHDKFYEHDWEKYYESKSTLRSLRSELERQEHILFIKGVIENYNSDGMADSSCFTFTDKAKDMFFKELEIGMQQGKNLKGLLKHDSFAEKQLFYNPHERSQIEQLSQLLMPEKFASVQQSLEESGMRKGFACLFYGSPGTGKTETVYQLARRTRRDVMLIDVSQIKSCWVGESEKNIKKAFERYRNYVKQCELAPIMLFNEADAVLGIRQEGAQSAVEKMENSIQNIILQEIEQLDGIMIATTNLTQNLDKAFERRFIYKIEFSRPSIEAKKAIWRAMIPTLAEPLAEELAAEYDFSGGQIENIARKRTVEIILSGKEPTSEKLHAMCRTEYLADNENRTRRRIGYL